MPPLLKAVIGCHPVPLQGQCEVLPCDEVLVHLRRGSNAEWALENAGLAQPTPGAQGVRLARPIPFHYNVTKCSACSSEHLSCRRITVDDSKVGRERLCLHHCGNDAGLGHLLVQLALHLKLELCILIIAKCNAFFDVGSFPICNGTVELAHVFAEAPPIDRE